VVPTTTGTHDTPRRRFVSTGDYAWGSWRLNADVFTLELFDDAGHWRYEVDLERCESNSAVLDWIIQVAGKAWANAACLAGLVHALDDVLDPQATLCSWRTLGDKTKSLTRREIRALVRDAVRRGAPLTEAA
jgi:hypothetical protein